jgi:hypothetical protein
LHVRLATDLRGPIEPLLVEVASVVADQDTTRDGRVRRRGLLGLRDIGDVGPERRDQVGQGEWRLTPGAPPPIATTGRSTIDASTMTGQARVEPNG